MKKILLVFFTVLIQFTFAQNKVSGVVTSKDDGQPLPGVSVIIKGSTKGTTTDFDGKYSIETNEGDVLIFSFIGMQNQEITVKRLSATGTLTIDVALLSDAKMLDDVVVTAYGSQSKKTITGSVVSVSEKTITESPTGNAFRAIQGQVAGVQISGTGTIGGSPAIRIRGYGSLGKSSTNAPLVVVDGVIGAVQPPQSDIASISILKDAASTSLYGSRASNGVVVITTKKGKGKPRINFSYTKTFQDWDYKKYSLLGAADFYAKTWEGLKNRGLLDGKSEAEAIKYANDEVKKRAGFNPFNKPSPFNDDGTYKSDAKLMYDTDWRSKLVRTGVFDDLNFNVSGSKGAIDYYFGYRNLNQLGTAIGEEYGGNQFRINLSSDINEYVSFGVASTYNSMKGRNIRTGYSELSIIGALNSFPNVVPIYELDENFKPIWNAKKKRPYYNYKNPVYNDINPFRGLEDPEGYQEDNFDITLNLEVRIIDGLVYKAVGNTRKEQYSSFYFRNGEHGNGRSVGGGSFRYSLGRRTYFTSHTLNYDYSIDNLHNFEALLGYEVFKYKEKDFSASSQGYPLGSDFIELSTGAEASGKPSSSTTESAMLSMLSRLRYNFDQKYFFTASLRRDGSSRFGPNKKYGVFGSFGASWIISEEGFFEYFKEYTNFLKFKVSYGTTGNQAIGDYRFMELYSTGANYNDEPGLIHSQLKNPDLSWESNKSFNIGFDVEFLDRRIALSYEYYYKLNNMLLMDKPLPTTTGFSSVLANVGGLVNKGHELSITSKNYITEDFSWTTNFNISKNVNEVAKLVEGQDQVIYGSKRWVIGKSSQNFYIRQWAGVNSDNGKPQWWDYGEWNKDKKVFEHTFKEGDKGVERDSEGRLRKITNDYNKSDRVDSGNANPLFTSGMRNVFSYKGVELSMFLYLSYGGKIYDYTMASNMHDGSGREQLHSDVLKSWKKKGDKTDVPKYIVNRSDKPNNRSTRFLYDSSFLRVKNISLGYSLPQDLVSYTKFISSVKFNFTMENVYTFTKYPGYDPELGDNGLTGNQMPNVRSYMFGVNISF